MVESMPCSGEGQWSQNLLNWLNYQIIWLHFSSGMHARNNFQTSVTEGNWVGVPGGYVLCTGDIQCHIPDTKHRCARTPCIDVRNLILGINICLCVFLLTSWTYRMKKCFDYFFFFFPVTVCAREITWKMSAQMIKFWQNNKQIKMHPTTWSGTLYSQLPSQLQSIYYYLFKKRGSHSYDSINVSVVGEIIEVQPNKIIQQQSENLEALKRLIWNLKLWSLLHSGRKSLFISGIAPSMLNIL